MAAELQTFMARRGAKAMTMLLILSCIALFTRYYKFESSGSHFRRAIFFRNNNMSLETQETQINQLVSWADGNGNINYK